MIDNGFLCLKDKALIDLLKEQGTLVKEVCGKGSWLTQKLPDRRYLTHHLIHKVNTFTSGFIRVMSFTNLHDSYCIEEEDVEKDQYIIRLLNKNDVDEFIKDREAK